MQNCLPNVCTWQAAAAHGVSGLGHVSHRSVIWRAAPLPGVTCRCQAQLKLTANQLICACRHARDLLESHHLLASWREANNPNKPFMWWVPSRTLAAAAAAAAAAKHDFGTDDESQNEGQWGDSSTDTGGSTEPFEMHSGSTERVNVDDDNSGSGSGSESETDAEQEPPAWPLALSSQVLLKLDMAGLGKLQHEQRMQRYLAAMLRAVLVRGFGCCFCLITCHCLV